MRSPPALEVLLGVAIMAYTTVLMYAAVRRPAWLKHPLLRPRAFRDHPAVHEVYSLVIGFFWWLFGAWLAWKGFEGG